MNIKNRLKKLEEEIVPKEDEFCQCFYKHEMALINQVYGEPFNAADILPNETPITDFCDRCNKPVSSTTRKYYRDLLLIWGDKVPDGAVNA